MRTPWLGLTPLLAALTLLSACGSVANSESAPGDAYSGESPRDGTGATPSPSPGGESPPTGDVTAPGQGTGTTPLPGQLTAGDWDDNLNFTFFQQYLAQPPGLPAYPSADRVLLTVRDADGQPIPNARVTVSGSAGTRLEAPTATDGRLVFLPTQDGAQPGESFTVTVAPPAGQSGSPLTTAVEGQDWTVTLPGAQGVLPSELDVAFVVDTTGSMGDELNYLKAEVQGLVRLGAHEPSRRLGALRAGVVPGPG